jgi:hypothetical protein
VVADALSRKNTTLLIQIDTQIFGLDEIKDQYSSNRFFGYAFAEYYLNKGVDDFYLHNGFLLKANKLCIKESSLRRLLLQESHEVDSWDTLDATRPMQCFPHITIVQE